MRFAALTRCAAAALVVVLGIGCRGAAPRSLDDEARQYVRLAVALGERDPDSLDFYAGPADAVADIRRGPPPLTAIKRDAEQLSARVRARHDADPVERTRAGGLVRDLAAIVARVDLLAGTRLPYDQESAVFFGVIPGPVDDRRLEAIRAQIAASVGRGGRLGDRYAAFASRFTIPPDRLRPVMEAALDACREATLAHLAMPAGEQASLEFVVDQPWSAFSRHLGGARSVIRINTDFRFTIDQALQLACHEGYPGHHTRNTLTTAGASGGRSPERFVQLTFSPESLRSEASAMLAADVAFSSDERLRVERDRLFPIAGLPSDAAASGIEVERLAGELQIVQADVARRYLDGELEFARAAKELEARTLVPRADAQIRYINQFRSYVTTYTAGRADAAARLIACAGSTPTDDRRWRCFLPSITNP
jgi:hypothetical protein